MLYGKRHTPKSPSIVSCSQIHTDLHRSLCVDDWTKSSSFTLNKVDSWYNSRESLNTFAYIMPRVAFGNLLVYKSVKETSATR